MYKYFLGDFFLMPSLLPNNCRVFSAPAPAHFSSRIKTQRPGLFINKLRALGAGPILIYSNPNRLGLLSQNILLLTRWSCPCLLWSICVLMAGFSWLSHGKSPWVLHMVSPYFPHGPSLLFSFGPPHWDWKSHPISPAQLIGWFNSYLPIRVMENYFYITLRLDIFDHAIFKTVTRCLDINKYQHLNTQCTKPFSNKKYGSGWRFS